MDDSVLLPVVRHVCMYSYNIMNLRNYFTKGKRPYSAYDVRVHGRGCAVAGEGSLLQHERSKAEHGDRQQELSLQGAAPRLWSGELGGRGRARGLARALRRATMAASLVSDAC
jgi:hypothetical protein